MDTDPVDLRKVPTHARVLEATVTLANPQSQLRLRLPGGQAGRADVLFDKKVWAAKHYWPEPDGVVVYEFDEPLPAGQVTVRVPLAQPPD